MRRCRSRPVSVFQLGDGQVLRHLGPAGRREGRGRRPVPAAGRHAGTGAAGRGGEGGRACRARSSRPSHEHLRPLHPPADRDRAPDGRPAAGRAGDLSAAAGGVAAQRQLPDDPGDRPAAGRRSRDHGLLGRHAARAAVLADPRRHPAHLDQRARLHPGQRAVRTQPRHRRRRNRRPVGDQRGDALSADRHALPADHPQGEPGRHADPGAGAHLRHAAADHGRRLRREHPGAEDLADAGRRHDRHRRPAEARHPRPGRSAGAGQSRHRPRGRAQRAQPGQRRPAQGHAQQPAPDLHPQHQRPADQARGLRRPDRRLPQRHAGAHPRHRPRHRRSRERPARRLVRQAAGHHPAPSSASPAPT